MTPERWRQIRDLLHGAMQLDRREQPAFLESHCADDPELRRELDKLLAAEGELAPSFLETPAVAWIADHLDSASRSTLLAAGTKLGPYVVHSLLGAGGMGEVYRARDAALMRDVAIKVLPASLSRDPDRLRRFQLEARAAAALNHPNILSIHHIGQQDGSPYIVTELLEGESLRERICHGAMRLREALDVAIAVARGLAAAHDKGIAHRDLKPENLFLTKDDHVKILDFGLAKLFQGQPPIDGSTLGVQEQTDPGHIMGTVGYMSPEQVRGQPADARSDIFALGCVLYEMLTGKRAFRKQTSAETMSAILNEDPPAASRITPNIPPALQRVMNRCLEKAPERRFQSASDLAFALDALSDSGSDSLSGIGQVHSWRGRPWLVWSLFFAVLVPAMIAAWIYYHTFKQRAPASQAWEQVTDFPDSAVAPALSYDGKLLAFVRGSDSFLSTGDIYVKLLPRGEAVQLTRQDKLKETPQFSPDGSQIAYSIDPPWDTWVVPVLGGEARLMLPNASGLSWIDSHHMLFSEIKSGIHMGIVTATESRSEQRDVYVPAHEEGMAHRSYISPDHKWVLVAMEMGPPVGDMPCRIVPFDGSSQGRVVGPPAASSCTYAGWSPDGKWMFFSAKVGNASHLWRQAFPDGEPEQLTFGPTEEDGVAVAPDGQSLLTSVGFKLRTVWVHDPSGDRQISFDGSARLIGAQNSSRAIFSPDGSKLLFLGQQNSGEAAELWQANLASGQVERLLPGIAIASSFDVSADGSQLVFDSFDPRGKPQLWIARLDHRSPPRQFESGSSESSPLFGRAGDLFFLAQEEGKSYLYRRPQDGGPAIKVTTRPVVRFETISPDGKWLVAEAAIGGEDITRGVLALNTNDGTIKRVCYSLCIVRWTQDGKLLYIALPGSAESSMLYKTFMVPLKQGDAFPDLPVAGIKTETDLMGWRGVKIVNGLVHPGPDISRYAYERTSDHRNIYRVPIHQQ